MQIEACCVLYEPSTGRWLAGPLLYGEPWASRLADARLFSTSMHRGSCSYTYPICELLPLIFDPHAAPPAVDTVTAEWRSVWTFEEVQ